MTIDESPKGKPDDPKPGLAARALAAAAAAMDSWSQWIRLLLLIIVVGLTVFAAVHFMHLDVTVGPLKVVENTRTGS